MGIVLASYASVGSHMDIVPVVVRCPSLCQAPRSHVLKPRPPSEQNGRCASAARQAALSLRANADSRALCE